MNADHDRYHRQRILPEIGEEGQRVLSRSRVLLIGCGALGTVIAEQLVRGGIGFIRIVDRDLVELTNLQRQVLFDESDARDGTPKAVAAAKRLRAINSQVQIDPHVVDVDSEIIEPLLRIGDEFVDVVLDGTDNVQTRYLLNDAAVKHGVKWVYGACVGVEGRVMSVLPGETACLRCVFPDPPAPADLQTCDTAGVLASAASLVASFQTIAAIKLLLCKTPTGLLRIDAISSRIQEVDTISARRDDCPTCAMHQFQFLNAPTCGAAQLCGRSSVQVRPAARLVGSLDELAMKLKNVMTVERTPHLLRCSARDGSDAKLTVFPDGRAIVHGTTDLARARSIYARFVGA